VRTRPAAKIAGEIAGPVGMARSDPGNGPRAPGRGAGRKPGPCAGPPCAVRGAHPDDVHDANASRT